MRSLPLSCYFLQYLIQLTKIVRRGRRGCFYNFFLRGCGGCFRYPNHRTDPSVANFIYISMQVFVSAPLEKWPWVTSILSKAISRVMTRSGYSWPVTSRAPSAFCAEDAEKTGKRQVHACNSTCIIIITVVAVIVIITFIFCFSVFLRLWCQDM